MKDWSGYGATMLFYSVVSQYESASARRGVQDYKDGSHSQVTASTMDNKWREDFERMKKARVHRCESPLSLRPLHVSARLGGHRGFGVGCSLSCGLGLGCMQPRPRCSCILALTSA